MVKISWIPQNLIILGGSFFKRNLIPLKRCAIISRGCLHLYLSSLQSLSLYSEPWGYFHHRCCRVRGQPRPWPHLPGCQSNLASHWFLAWRLLTAFWEAIVEDKARGGKKQTQTEIWGELVTYDVIRRHQRTFYLTYQSILPSYMYIHILNLKAEDFFFKNLCQSSF